MTGVAPLIIIAFAMILIVGAIVRAVTTGRVGAVARVDGVLGDWRVRGIIGAAIMAAALANYLNR